MGESALVETCTETATLELVDVISNVGGQTGLWIGISFLSLMEIIEMFYRLIRHHFHLVRIAMKIHLREIPKPDYDTDTVQVEVNKE